MILKMLYKEGLPTYEKMFEYLETLQAGFIEKIKLGGKAIDLNTMAQYRETTFKKNIGLK